jgi:hypothetical protein
MSLRAPAFVFRQEDAGAWQSLRQDNKIDRKIKYQFPATEAKINKIKIKEKRRKKDKKSRNKGFLTEILKNGVVGGSKKGDFIGLIRF